MEMETTAAARHFINRLTFRGVGGGGVLPFLIGLPH